MALIGALTGRRSIISLSLFGGSFGTIRGAATNLASVDERKNPTSRSLSLVRSIN